MVIALFVVAAVTGQPSGEALKLGREIAESGTLASFADFVSATETNELIEAHPELSASEKARLTSTARAVYDAGRERLMQATARAYAEQLTINDLRSIAAFWKSSAGQTYRASFPAVISATAQSLGKMDFKGDVEAAFCKETGKLCSK